MTTAPNDPRPIDLTTLPHAAKRYGIDIKRLREARDAGVLPVFVIGERWQRVRIRDLEAWLESKRRADGPRTRAAICGQRQRRTP